MWDVERMKHARSIVLADRTAEELTAWCAAVGGVALRPRRSVSVCALDIASGNNQRQRGSVSTPCRCVHLMSVPE
jgi:hypothetical protein